MIIQKIIDFFVITNIFHLFVLVLATYIFTFYYHYLTRPNPLPGPLPLPFIGNLHNFYDTKLFYEKCQQKYGDLCEIIFNGGRCIIISRPEYMEKFLNPTSFSMRMSYSQGIDELGLYGRGIVFNNDYKSWYYHRQFFAQALLTSRFIDTAINSTNKLFEELSGYWQSLGMQSSFLNNDNNNNNNNSNNNNWTLEINLSAWLNGFANDIISIVTTGERTYATTSYYNTQSVTKSEHPDALVEDYNKFVTSSMKFVIDPLFFILFGPFVRHYVPIIRNISISKLKNRDYVFKRFDMIIKNRRKKIDELPLDAEMKGDMLTTLITANTSRDTINVKTVDGEMLKPMNDEQIRENLIGAIIPGTDNISKIFCFITYHVCKYPHVKEKMLLEIDTIFPKSSSEKLHVSHDISKLKYCKAIIKETGRMLPATYVIPRCTFEECEIAGYKWPAGTLFQLNRLAANKNPELWSNPEIFDPDRFYDDNKYDTKINDKNLAIFGGSQRICPGRKFGMTELLLLMVLVFKNYNVELVNKNESLKVKTGISITCRELKVRINPRN